MPWRLQTYHTFLGAGISLTALIRSESGSILLEVMILAHIFELRYSKHSLFAVKDDSN